VRRVRSHADAVAEDGAAADRLDGSIAITAMR
jgi:hypothetical protein